MLLNMGITAHSANSTNQLGLPFCFEILKYTATFRRSLLMGLSVFF